MELSITSSQCYDRVTSSHCYDTLAQCNFQTSLCLYISTINPLKHEVHLHYKAQSINDV
jgi:hypothetical protein